MKTGDCLFELQFLKRCSVRSVFFLISGVFTCGVIFGAAFVKLFGLTDDQSALPLPFYKTPLIGLGVLQGFSDMLMNAMFFLIAIFLLGITAFGAIGIPLLIFYKGAVAAMSALFLLYGGDLLSLGRSALFYTPALAAASLLLILFATRAFVFSRSLAAAGFSKRNETLDFRLYFSDFIYFLCFSVVVSFVGGLLASLYGLF